MQPITENPEMLNATNKALSVLVVDDDEVTVFISEMLLKDYFTTSSAPDGYKALEMIEQNKYNIILMDINLGDINMDGIKTMRMIKQDKRFKDTKIFAVTSFSNNRKWFIEQGFDDLFIKPLSVDVILETLKTVKS